MQGILWNFYDCDELGITDTDLGQENGFIDLPRAFQHWNSIIWPLLGLLGKSKYFLQQACLFNYKINRPWKFFTYSIAIKYYSYMFSSVNIYLKWNISKTIYFWIFATLTNHCRFCCTLADKLPVPKNSVFIGWN